MSEDEVTKFLTPILEKNKNPILLVTLKKDGREQRFCGKFRGWVKEDGWLWLHNDGKIPVMISSDSLSSIKEVAEKDLIDNINSLFRIVEAVRQSVC